MMAIEPIKVNIVEEEGWKDWDYATPNGISSWAMDSAFDDWKNMEDATCRDYVEALVNASLPKKKRLKFSWDDLEAICEEMREDRHGRFESVSQAILDAHEWAWEEAYSPDDKDIRIAMEKAERNWDWDFRMAPYWDLTQTQEFVEGPRDWSPRPRSTWTLPEIYDQFMKEIHYEHEGDYYDRFLIFNWGNTPVVKRLLEVLKMNPKEGSQGDVESDLEDMSNRYLRVFFKELQGRMQNKDVHVYWDLDPHWKNVLKDKSRMIGIRKEFEEFLERKGKD